MLAFIDVFHASIAPIHRILGVYDVRECMDVHLLVVGNGVKLSKMST